MYNEVSRKQRNFIQFEGKSNFTEHIMNEGHVAITMEGMAEVLNYQNSHKIKNRK